MRTYAPRTSQAFAVPWPSNAESGVADNGAVAGSTSVRRLCMIAPHVWRSRGPACPCSADRSSCHSMSLHVCLVTGWRAMHLLGFSTTLGGHSRVRSAERPVIKTTASNVGLRGNRARNPDTRRMANETLRPAAPRPQTTADGRSSARLDGPASTERIYITARGGRGTRVPEGVAGPTHLR